MALKNTILDKVSAVVDSVWPSKKPKIYKKPVELTPDPEDLPNVSNVKMGRGGRNSHIVYKKR